MEMQHWLDVIQMPSPSQTAYNNAAPELGQPIEWGMTDGAAWTQMGNMEKAAWWAAAERMAAKTLQNEVDTSAAGLLRYRHYANVLAAAKRSREYYSALP
jgi:hypothetical protein